MYKHTQVGHRTIGILLGTGALTAGLLVARAGPILVLGVVLMALLTAAFLFGSLTTEVDEQRFTFWFGPGVMRRSFALSHILSCTPVTSPWWYGSGIHWTPDGWLYNVASGGAVQLTLGDGRRLRVGTDEPEELCRLIRIRKGAAPA
jgi:hypothetical protein